MSKFPAEDVKRLNKLLNEELDLYVQIRKLTEKQTELLSKDEIEAFNESLDKRETLIEKIKGLHQESETLMHSYISFSSKENKKDDTIDGLKDKIRNELEICADLNNQNIQMIDEKTKDQSKKIDEQSAKRKTIGGYAQSVPNIPEVFDKKS